MKLHSHVLPNSYKVNIKKGSPSIIADDRDLSLYLSSKTLRV